MFLRRSAVAPLIVGLFGFLNVSRNPRFDSIHTVDVLQLLVSGMCFGIALAALIARRRTNALKASGLRDEVARG
jgi:hypothetical protein